MKTTHNISQQDATLPEPLAQGAAELRKRFGDFYDTVFGILRMADVNANYLMTGFDYDIETQLIVRELPQAHSQADVEHIIREAFAHWFRGGRKPGEQEDLRFWYAAYHVWNAWQDWKEERGQAESGTRAGTLLTYHR